MGALLNSGIVSKPLQTWVNLWRHTGKLLSFCKSWSQKACSYHQDTLTVRAFFRTFNSVDESSRPILNSLFSRTGYYFLSWIKRLFGFEKTNVWAICTPFGNAKINLLYSIVTGSLERNFLVSLTGLRRVFQILPNTIQSGHAWACSRAFHWRNG